MKRSYKVIAETSARMLEPLDPEKPIPTPPEPLPELPPTEPLPPDPVPPPDPSPPSPVPPAPVPLPPIIVSRAPSPGRIAADSRV
ncbi:MAG TPA: hypothetical protein VF064_06180 [Pyrinomonadaceae bacterium]